MGEFVTLRASDGHELSAYLSKPSETVRGALVVVQEIFGVNAHIRSVADAYAREGYVSIAPALFDRYERGVELKYEGEGMKKAFELYPKLDPNTAVLDIAAAFAQVATEGAGAGVVGFCYGGLMSWLSATRGPAHGFQPKACVGYYAGGIGKVANEQPTCPVMLHFGAGDDHIGRDQIDAVRNAHPDVQVFLYEGAGHAFNRDISPSFRPEAAAMAKERTLDFFAEHLR